jgi:hypothetical protein
VLELILLLAILSLFVQCCIAAKLWRTDTPILPEPIDIDWGQITQPLQEIKDRLSAPTPTPPARPKPAHRCQFKHRSTERTNKMIITLSTCIIDGCPNIYREEVPEIPDPIS